MSWRNKTAFLLLTPTNMAARTIQFTQEQARTLSGITPEAWRHWRSLVPYLAAKRGKAARFSIGEIVAMSVMRHAVQDLGVSVGRLAASFDELCVRLSPMRPVALSEVIALIGPDSALVVAATDPFPATPSIILSIACRPIVERLALTTFPTFAETQPPLPFGPRMVGGTR